MSDSEQDAADDRTDRIEDARRELQSLDERPVDEHPEVFADVNASIVDELSAMEDV